MGKLEKVNPQEFGLEEKSVKTIEEAFSPKIVERDGLAVIYGELIKQELTYELCANASELRKKLVKVRTGIAGIHKTQKAFFLSAGRFVDAWKNKETLPISQMEEKLTEIETHFENLEKEKAKKIQEERVVELSPFVEDAEERELASMPGDVWSAYLTAKKTAYNDRIEAEKQVELNRIAEEKRIEKERLECERKEAEERKRIEEENIKLKKEAEEKEKAEKIRFEKAEKERKIEEEKQAKQRQEQEAKLQKEREAREKVEAELEAKQVLLDTKMEAEKENALRLENELKEQIQLELNKGDSEKVKDLISDLEGLKINSFKSDKNKKMFTEVCSLIDKVVGHIKK